MRLCYREHMLGFGIMIITGYLVWMSIRHLREDEIVPAVRILRRKGGLQVSTTRWFNRIVVRLTWGFWHPGGGVDFGTCFYRSLPYGNTEQTWRLFFIVVVTRLWCFCWCNDYPPLGEFAQRVALPRATGLPVNYGIRMNWVRLRAP